MPTPMIPTTGTTPNPSTRKVLPTDILLINPIILLISQNTLAIYPSNTASCYQG